MYIQYVGFDTAVSSRVYKFHVIDTHEVREFTVNVQSAAFRSACLKLQDGPAICFARLQQELEGETPGSRVVENRLSIEEHDIREYWERHHPRPPLEQKTESRRWIELNERYRQASPSIESNAPVR